MKGRNELRRNSDRSIGSAKSATSAKSAMSAMSAMTANGTAASATGMSGGAGRGPIVIKVGGAMLDEPHAADAMLDAVVAAHRRHGAGPGVIIVHGGGKAVDRQLDRVGLPTERREGIRITPPEQMDQIAGVLAGVINTSLVGHFTSRGVPAVGLGLSDGLCCRVELDRSFAFDPGRVGEIVGGDGRLLSHLLAGGFLPVMSSIGLDATGGLLNVNADDAAAAVAALVGASALLLLTDVPGVRGPAGTILESIDRATAEAWIADGTISGGMIVKVRGALEAAEHAGASVGRVVIASWTDANVLDRLLAGGTGGTRVGASEGARTSDAAPRSGATGAAMTDTSSPNDGALCAKDA